MNEKFYNFCCHNGNNDDDVDGCEGHFFLASKMREKEMFFSFWKAHLLLCN